MLNSVPPHDGVAAVHVPRKVNPCALDVVAAMQHEELLNDNTVLTIVRVLERTPPYERTGPTPVSVVVPSEIVFEDPNVPPAKLKRGPEPESTDASTPIARL